MRVFKAVRQSYVPSPEVTARAEQFRQMTNDCIVIGLKNNLTSLKALSSRAYRSLSEYDTPSYYKACAVSRAAAILRGFRKRVRRYQVTDLPSVRRPTLTTCYGFKISNGALRLPLGRGTFIALALNEYVRQTLNTQGVSVKSVTLTDCQIILNYSRDTEPTPPAALVAIDTNFQNLTLAHSDGTTERFELAEVARLREKYRRIRGHFRRNDRRVARRILSKYGEIERNKVCWILHNVSAAIVRDAKARQSAIIMEDVRKIGVRFRRGNGKGLNYRAKMTSWSYREIQREIDYKARWIGLPVMYVNPAGTSAMCSACGSRVCPNEHRRVHCPKCGQSWDRDENAARNILKRGALRFGAGGPALEAMKGNRSSSGFSRVDAGKSVG